MTQTQGAEHSSNFARSFHCAIEPLFFRARDWLSPPEKKLIEVGIRPCWHVLDFGCGIGSYTIAAASLVGEDGRVYAVDINPSRIDRVRALAVRHGLDNVRTINTDCDTTLESGTFDAVLLYDVLHGLEQPEDVLAEIHRVLKPGGAFKSAARGHQTYTFIRSGGRG